MKLISKCLCRCPVKLSRNQPSFNSILADQIFYRFYLKLQHLYFSVPSIIVFFFRLDPLGIHQRGLAGGKTPDMQNAICFGCVEDTLQRSYELIEIRAKYNNYETKFIECDYSLRHATHTWSVLRNHDEVQASKNWCCNL